MTAWTSSAGVRIEDLVPAPVRRQWVERGLCPGRDLYTLFSERVRAHPERAAVVDSAGALDYAALDARVRRMAARFGEVGLGARDIVAVCLPNGREAVAAELAVAAVGAVALPYPPGHGSRGPESLLRRSRARALVVTDAEEAAPYRRLPHVEAVFTTAACTGRGRPGGGASSEDAVPSEGAAWPVRSLAAEARSPFVPRSVDPEAPARILVSSGSEAEPKMVAYSHNAMGGGRAAYVRALHDGAGPMRNLLLAPLASSFGSCGTSVTVAALGGTLLVRERFDPADALRAISEHRPTHVLGVPTMLRRIAEQPAGENEDFTGLRALVSSGAALPDATAEACRRRFDRPVITVYGSSDGVNCHTAVTGLTPGGPGVGTGTGLPDPRVARIRITDETGRPVPDGTLGEIQARGPMTPLGYVAAPELDARYRAPAGWVRTGDLGVLDARGRLHVQGRLKQIVVRGGYNISPAEVERELAAHPAVAEVACVGVPDEDLGERLCACVREAPGSGGLQLRQLTGFLETDRGLERRKLPELLLRIPQMPLGPTGKVCRATLTRLAAERHAPGGGSGDGNGAGAAEKTGLPTSGRSAPSSSGSVVSPGSAAGR